MCSISGDKNRQMRKAFAEKVKNMVGIIRQNLQNHGGHIELVGIDTNNTIKIIFRLVSKELREK